jgi:hypothetical protein
MTRVGESGDENEVTYSYSGNQLTSSIYDLNGNITYDVTSGLTMEWNHLDLIKKVSNNSGVLINYTYLSDGTKVRSVDASGEGLEYRGSLTFRRSSDGTLTPESIAFPGGRFIAMKSVSAPEEIEEARKAITLLGGKLERVIDYTLSDGNETLSRTIIIIQKTTHTPPKYPRNNSQISKKPL